MKTVLFLASLFPFISFSQLPKYSKKEVIKFKMSKIEVNQTVYKKVDDSISIKKNSLNDILYDAKGKSVGGSFFFPIYGTSSDTTYIGSKPSAIFFNSGVVMWYHYTKCMQKSITDSSSAKPTVQKDYLLRLDSVVIVDKNGPLSTYAYTYSFDLDSLMKIELSIRGAWKVLKESAHNSFFQCGDYIRLERVKGKDEDHLVDRVFYFETDNAFRYYTETKTNERCEKFISWFLSENGLRFRGKNNLGGASFSIEMIDDNSMILIAK